MSQDVRERVQERYGEAAEKVLHGEERAGCGCGCSEGADLSDAVTRDLYDEGTTAGLPAKAVQASLGCGNPTALAELREGETVLDLGSGGGIDVLLSARRVGPTGFAYGVDMTESMLDLARSNAREAGAENVEFLEGTIEDLPLPDAAVDVILSNCVINLSADKTKVFHEAFRVLRPGGRFAVSDVILESLPDEALKRDMALWVGCVAGALTADQFEAGLTEAGFEDVSLETTRRFGLDEANGIANVDGDAAPGGRTFASALIRARKPGEA